MTPGSFSENSRGCNLPIHTQWSCVEESSRRVLRNNVSEPYKEISTISYRVTRNRMRYRSRAEIIATLLKAGLRGASKTKLMYSAMLSYEQLQAYLKFTQEKGLIAQDGESSRYSTTAKGMRFMERYAKIGHLLTPVEKVVELPKASMKPTMPKNPAPAADA